MEVGQDFDCLELNDDLAADNQVDAFRPMISPL